MPPQNHWRLINSSAAEPLNHLIVINRMTKNVNQA